ncbi:MAG: hypothetical protein Q9170_006568 [Blastenia crenularia]
MPQDEGTSKNVESPENLETPQDTDSFRDNQKYTNSPDLVRPKNPCSIRQGHARYVFPGDLATRLETHEKASTPTLGKKERTQTGPPYQRGPSRKIKMRKKRRKIRNGSEPSHVSLKEHLDQDLCVLVPKRPINEMKLSRGKKSGSETGEKIANTEQEKGSALAMMTFDTEKEDGNKARKSHPHQPLYPEKEKSNETTKPYPSTLRRIQLPNCQRGPQAGNPRLTREYFPKQKKQEKKKTASEASSPLGQADSKGPASQPRPIQKLRRRRARAKKKARQARENKAQEQKSQATGVQTEEARGR